MANFTFVAKSKMQSYKVGRDGIGIPIGFGRDYPDFFIKICIFCSNNDSNSKLEWIFFRKKMNFGKISENFPFSVNFSDFITVSIFYRKNFRKFFRGSTLNSTLPISIDSSLLSFHFISISLLSSNFLPGCPFYLCEELFRSNFSKCSLRVSSFAKFLSQ